MATNSDSGLCCLVFPLSCGNGKKWRARSLALCMRLLVFFLSWSWWCDAMVWGRNEEWLEEVRVRGTSKVAVESNIREKRRVTERVCFFIIGSFWWRRRWSRRCCLMGCDWFRDLVELEVDMILDLGNKLVESQQQQV
jgi:hypothetical protein